MTKQDILAIVPDPHFKDWLGFELDHEDVTNHAGQIIDENVAGDSGGRTFAGIDEASHPWFPYLDPTPQAVVNAYKKDWLAVHADMLPHPVGATVANFGVNCGSSEAIRILQQSLGVKADGAIGSITIGATKASDPVSVALRVVDYADAHYQSLADNNSRLRKFLRGWLNRDADMRAFDKSEA